MSTCYALQFPVFQPAMRIIESITQSNPAIVTTTFSHLYVSGTIVRFDLPPAVGMQQLNQQQSAITVTGATTFTIPIDTSSYAPFSIPMSPNPHTNTCAQVVPVGEINKTLLAAVQNVLPY